jgi:hypothetical protein
LNLPPPPDENKPDPRQVSIIPDLGMATPFDIDLDKFQERDREDARQLFQGLVAAYEYSKQAHIELQVENCDLRRQLEAQKEAHHELVKERDRHKHVAKYLEERGRRSRSPEPDPRKKELKFPDPPLLSQMKLKNKNNHSN